MITLVCSAQYALNSILFGVVGLLSVAMVIILLISDYHIKNMYRKLEEDCHEDL